MSKINQKKYSSFEYLKLIFTIDKRHIIVLIIEIFASLFWSLAPLGLTNYILTIYEKDNQMSGYMIVLIVCGAYTLFRTGISFLTMYMYGEYVQIIYRKFREKITSKILKKVLDVDLLTYQSISFLDDYQKVIDNVTDNMISIFWDVTSLLGGVVSLISIGTILSIINPIILIYGLVIGISSYFISKLSSKIMHNLSEKNKQLIRKRGYVRRVFYLKDYAIDLRTTGINKLYLHRNEQYGEDIIKNINNSYNKYNLLNSFDHILLNSVFAVALSIVTFTVIESKDIKILATLLSAILYLSDDINYFASSVASYKSNIIYKNDYFRVMNQCSEIEKNDKNLSINKFESIEFKNVSFDYGDKKALKNISLKINKHDKIAIVGENGAGKTTFIKLLLRLYDPTDGDVLINNVNYKEYNSFEIRKQFVTVFQEYQIYALTIAENILLRKCNSKEDEEIVYNALKKVDLYDKVMAFEKGIYTMCTTEFDKDGIEFSGGERQKFVIARIFASPAPILLLDEPNSALDPIAERNIFKEIFNYSFDKTLIFISHRFSTTIMSDRIYLFSDGEILEEGTHHELMQNNNGKYKNMFDIQAYEYLNGGDNNEKN